MRCKGLFERNKIVIIPVIDEEVGNMMRDVKSYATYHDITIKTETGIFVNQNTMRVEKVIRCEVIGEFKPIIKKVASSPNIEALKQAREERRRAREEKRLAKEKRKLARMEENQKREERRKAREERNKQIFHDFHQNNLPVKELAIKYKMSRQGIYDILDKE